LSRTTLSRKTLEFQFFFVPYLSRVSVANTCEQYKLEKLLLLT
jgi:hypothetical protein